VDITFVPPGDSRIPDVNETNCYNSTDLGFATIYSITTQAIGSAANISQPGSGASRLLLGSSVWSWLGYLPAFAGAAWLLM
jgi:hypothetical protein